ncbi:hypothetical protein KDAU_55020 [Dictyobacter aurantiacus]|uniref:Uncharacterized protein n=1 Tax=Dictyobacter aurantiacus TaxID=1936993 RepID=A0A401ZMU3_9CHLR|nr:hypothetical protein KDAU_55020 [Dictyobacter aurantiacus]
MQKPPYRTPTERHAQGRIAAFQKKYRIEEAAILCRLRGNMFVSRNISMLRWTSSFLVACSKVERIGGKPGTYGDMIV